MLLVAAAALAVAAMALRLAGPSDLWDQAQPRTIAYTVDMLAHGGASWILPVDGEGRGATKPPLYNWLAAPVVAVAGRASETAHRLPSVLSFAALVALLGWIGARFDPPAPPGEGGHDLAAARGLGTGWLAAIMLTGSYPLYKLGGLARPDMPLVLLLTIAWWAATRLVVDGVGAEARGAGDADGVAHRMTRLRRAWRAVFWASTVAAAWTKGPAALLPLLYALLAARLIVGRWSAWARVGAWWAAPALAAMLAWPFGVWIIDPHHLTEQLLGNELFGRLTGAGPEGGRKGLREIIVGLPKMPAYFMVRFAPWSALALAGTAGAIVAWRRLARGDGRASAGEAQSTREAPEVADAGDDAAALAQRRVLLAAAIFIGLVLVLFSLSSGKRADYVAPALPPAALLASWWLLEACPLRWRSWAAASVVVVAAGAVGLMAAAQRTTSPLPKGAQEAIDEIVAGVGEEARAFDGPVVALRTPAEQLPALVATGRPCESGVEAVGRRLEALRPGERLLLAYTEQWIPHDLRQRLEEIEREGGVVHRRRVWTMPWKAEDPPPERTVVLVEVAR